MINHHSENGKTIVIENFIFDSEDEEDIELLEEYTEDNEELNESNFREACLSYLHENEGGDLSQHFIPYIILDESQKKELKDLL